jgi:hypothetical protein
MTRDQRPTVRIQPLSNQALASQYQASWKEQRRAIDLCSCGHTHWEHRNAGDCPFCTCAKFFPHPQPYSRPTQDDLELSQEEDQEHAGTD